MRGEGHASSKHRRWLKQAAGGRAVRSDWLWDTYQRDLDWLEENEDLMFVCCLFWGTADRIHGLVL